MRSKVLGINVGFINSLMDIADVKQIGLLENMLLSMQVFIA